MSRNKILLFMIILVIVYMVMPDSGIYGAVKANIAAALPFTMMGVIIYVVITISALKRAWKKLDAVPNDENTVNFAKIMNISFDVKRMLGPGNLSDLYRKISFSPDVSLKAKELLYQAMRRKRLDVPPPGQGADVDRVIRNLKKPNKRKRKSD